MVSRKAAFASGLTVALALAASSAIAQGVNAPDGPMPFFWGHGMLLGGPHLGRFGMVLGPVVLVLTLIGIIEGIGYALRHSGGPGPHGFAHPSRDRAMAYLKERYAKGEIDSREFEERRKLLAD